VSNVGMNFCFFSDALKMKVKCAKGGEQTGVCYWEIEWMSTEDFNWCGSHNMEGALSRWDWYFSSYGKVQTMEHSSERLTLMKVSRMEHCTELQLLGSGNCGYSKGKFVCSRWWTFKDCSWLCPWKEKDVSHRWVDFFVDEFLMRELIVV
jgi:hypothetical protein